MATPTLHPGHILVYSPEEIQRILGESSDEPASDALSVSNWKPHLYQIAAISADSQTITAIVLIRRGNRLRTTTDKYRVFFDHSVQFAPITLKELTSKKLLTLFKHHSNQLLNTVAPDDWQKLMLAIKSLRPESETQLQHLEDLLKNPIPVGDEKSSDGWITVALERDALHTALQLSGFPTALLPPSGATEPMQPLQTMALNHSEQAMLMHDMEKGLNPWQIEAMESKSVQVAQFRHENQILTVLNVNTTSLEDTLGVDLIYYRHDIDSFVLVQYKRMKKNAKDRWVYYPEGSYTKEYKKMAALSKGLKKASPQSLKTYRFHPQWNYFKFCPIDAFDPESNQAIRGYYIPLDFWQLYERDPASKGEKGGFRITQDTAHLDTHTFTHLFSVGWIGSHGMTSEKISAIMREKLQKKRKSSVLIAWLFPKSSEQLGMDF